MRRKLLIFLMSAYAVLSCYGFIGYAGEFKLPTPPQGFTWKKCDHIKAAFLMPDGWFYKEEGKGDTKALFISKESIEGNGIFKTGFSVNAIPKITEKTGVIPSEYAKQLVESLKALPVQTCNQRDVEEHGHFKGCGINVRSIHPDKEIIIQYSLYLGNDATSTLYIFTFESPEGEWNAAWKMGEIILNNMVLATDF